MNRIELQNIERVGGIELAFFILLVLKNLEKEIRSYIFEEDVKFFVTLRVDSGLKQREEYVLQHLGKVWHQLLQSENITETHENTVSYCTCFSMRTVGVS